MSQRTRRAVASGWMAAAWAAVLAIGAPHPLRAQSASPALDVGDVIAATLAENPDIRTARTLLDAQRGALIQTAGPFDTRPSLTLSGSRTVRSTGVDPAQAVVGADLSQGSRYSTLGAESQLGLNKMFRSGVLFTSRVTTTQTSSVGLAQPVNNQLTITSDVTLPLFQGRGGGAFSLAERAAAHTFRASERALRATAATAVLFATRAYWEYRAAVERSEIQRAATNRSRQTVEEVKILIAADERPRSDIDLMVANAATKHATALDAERNIVHARYVLGLAVGLDVAATAALPLPATEFPTADDTESLPLEPLIAEALAHHDDLAAAQARKESSQLIRAGAANELQPRVDVVFRTGYTGRLSGGGVGGLFGAWVNNVLGPNASLQIVFEPTNINSVVRGGLIEADAALARSTIAAEALARSVRINVADALTALNGSRAQLDSTREAIERSRLALQTVQRNFELGSATLFDRILAEDTVTNAEMASLSANLRYALALVDLQFARGVLFDRHAPDLIADPQRVLRATREDAQ